MPATAAKPKSAAQPTSAPPQATSAAQFSAPAELGAVMKLQNLIGNQAVSRLLQAKLAIGSSTDHFEAEADRVAEAVTRPSTASATPCKCGRCDKCAKGASAAPISVQRRAAASSRGGPAPGSVDRVLARGGSPMPGAVRADMESRFGHDFSSVRLHTDPDAARSARDIGARAYTVGDHVVFGSNQFAPQSGAGRHLLAHELTHVLQQQNGAVRRSVQRKDDDGTAKLAQEMIPSATLDFRLDAVWFRLNVEATFQIGQKSVQMMRIALNALLREQYTEKLAVEVMAHVTGNKKQFTRQGEFEDTRDAYDGEKMAVFYFDYLAFDLIVKYLEKKGLTVHIDDEQRAKVLTGMAAIDLWADMLAWAGKNGLPPWYTQTVFNRQMATRAEGLEKYRIALAAFRKAKAKDTTAALQQAALTIIEELATEGRILEAMRNDVLLYQDPATQAGYQAIWYLEDKQQKTGKPADFLRSLDNAMAFVAFVLKDEEALANFRFHHQTRHDLLVKFIGEGGFKEENFKLLPPYPALIVAPDLNEDGTTITTAKNTFRMVNMTDQVHGGPLIHGVTIAMKRTIYYSWDVVPIPDSIKYMHEHGDRPAELVKAADTFVKNSPKSLNTPVKSYGPDRDWDQTVAMGDLGVGSYLMVGRAAPHYAEDMKWVQQPSSAGYPFFVFDAKTLASRETLAESNALGNIRKQLADTKDEKEKEALKTEVERLQTREGSGLGAVTAKDLGETQKLIDAANGLRKYILEDRAKGLPVRGDKDHDPFIVRLKRDFPKHHDIYMLIRDMFPPGRYDDIAAIDEYLKILEVQRKQLKELGDRVGDAEGRFMAGKPNYRVIATMIKEDDGNKVPLLLVAGMHPETPEGKFRIKLVDVTFKNAKMGDMVYLGETRDNEDDAVRSAFDKFASDNKYGHGLVQWRLPQKNNLSGQVYAEDNVWDYLQYALAAAGIIMLVLGTVASAGLLSPVAAGVVTALGVSLAVVGAAMSVRNIQERKDKGTFEFDTETALDIVNIIGAVVMVVGTVTKVTMAARATSLARVLMVQRLERLIAVYDLTELGANVYLIGTKVKEDVEAINNLDIPQHEKDAMISSVAFDAVQQGAMMSISAYSTLKGIPDTFRNSVEHSTYKSWMQKGWVKLGKKGKVEISDTAPPFLRKLQVGPGKAAPPDQQGDVAHRATLIEPMKQVKTLDGDHHLTLTERGRIIRCSDFCQDLRARFAKVLEQDPHAQQKLRVIEEKAAKAATDKDEAGAQLALDEAKVLESSLSATDMQWKKITGDSDPVPGPIELKPLGTVSGNAKSGVKIDPIVPAGPGRKIEIVDLMTSAEIAAPDGMQQALNRLGGVMGKTVADVPVLKPHWNAAVNKVLKGRSPDKATLATYDKIVAEFWNAVGKDRGATKVLKAAGITPPKDGKGPVAQLGPGGKGKSRDSAATRERGVDVAWRKDAPRDGDAFAASKVELVFNKPVVDKPHVKPKADAPPPKQPLILTPDEVRLQAHARSVGMLDTEIEIMVAQFRKHGMGVEEMEGNISRWAETRRQNPDARARMAPDYILDAASRAKIQHEEQKIAGTGGIESIRVRDDPEGGLAVEIEGTVLPQRLARQADDVTPTRRRAPDFNASKKLFSNEEAFPNKAAALVKRFWQRLHLWGPGFGDEAAVALFWGPRDVNLKWQNSSIENYIRKLATAAQARGMTTHVKAVAKSWGDVPGFQAPQGERFLRSVDYTVTLKGPDGRIQSTVRVYLEVNTPPNGGVKDFGVQALSGLAPTDLL